MSIDTIRSYRLDLRQDLPAHDPAASALRPWLAIKYPTVAFDRKLRTAAYLSNRASGSVSRVIGQLFRLRPRSAGMKLRFFIPSNALGPGPSIVRRRTIGMNDRARVGERCGIHPGSCLATKDGQVPTLGDDSCVGTEAEIIGGVALGDGVVVGAKAVVTRSFEAGSVLAGIPARSIGR